MIRRLKKGSTLGVVLILTGAVALLLASAFSYSIAEKKLNYSAQAWLDAKNAAEATVEAGFAQLQHRLEATVSFPMNGLDPAVSTSSPLTLPSSFYDMYRNSNVVLPTDEPYNARKAWGSYSTELIGGALPPGEWRFIDGSQAGNEFDPLRGMRAFVRRVNVLGKATVHYPLIGERTAYAMEELQIRDAPLFAHAIFYNMDLEIAPGAPMVVEGPVHANGTLYVQSSNSLSFMAKVTATGQIQWGRAPNSGQATANGSVNIVNGQNQLKNLYGNYDGKGTRWNVSGSQNYRQVASQTWQGNLQTTEHGVPRTNPVGIDDYQKDADASTAGEQTRNPAYQIIQPVVNKTPSMTPEQLEVEKAKFSYKAGLTLELRAQGSGYMMDVYTYKRDGAGDIVYDASGAPQKVMITSVDAATTSSESGTHFFSYKPYTETTSGSTTTVTSGMYDLRRASDGNSNDGKLSLIRVNVGKLADLVHANSGSDWGGTDKKPENWWNGIVYIQTPLAGTTREDGVSPAVGNLGVQLYNARVIPNPSYAMANNVYGTSFVTNNALYVQGHFNSDGIATAYDSNGNITTQRTGSRTLPDSNADFAQQGKEAPASLVGDAVTLLSPGWDNTKSKRAIADRVASVDTEVSAAILAGIAPTGKNGVTKYSGGAENFPRFLENWSGKTLVYRGSMVNLFESEVAKQRWQSNNVYSPPNRAWGFHAKFAEGFFPPGTPNVRTFRRVNYRELTQQEYKTEIQHVRDAFASTP